MMIMHITTAPAHQPLASVQSPNTCSAGGGTGSPLPDLKRSQFPYQVHVSCIEHTLCMVLIAMDVVSVLTVYCYCCYSVTGPFLLLGPVPIVTWTSLKLTQQWTWAILLLVPPALTTLPPCALPTPLLHPHHQIHTHTPPND